VIPARLAAAAGRASREHPELVHPEVIDDIATKTLGRELDREVVHT
jgi:hypothetical protein